MADRRNEANLLFLLYSLSTIGLLTSMGIYSSYLTWWWHDVTPATKLIAIEWQSYYIAYVVMTIIAGVILVWSFVAFLDFILNRGLNSPFVRSYLKVSLFSHASLLLLPILLMLLYNVSDPKIIIWTVWIIVNLILGLFALQEFEKYVTIAMLTPDSKTNLIINRI